MRKTNIRKGFHLNFFSLISQRAATDNTSDFKGDYRVIAIEKSQQEDEILLQRSLHFIYSNAHLGAFFLFSFYFLIFF
jgi:hypothetical protein